MSEQMDHLPLEQLADYVEGRMAPADAGKVEEHLATDCPVCLADLAWLEETFTLMTSDDWVEPPAAVRAAVQQAFRQRYRPAVLPPTLGELLRALFSPRLRRAMAVATTLVLLIAGGLVFQTRRGGVTIQTAALTDVTGDVEAMVVGEGGWRSASTSEIVRPGTHLRTGESSSAVLVFFDGSVTWLGPGAELRISQLRSRRDGNELIALHQSLGQTYNRVQPLPSPDSQFQIETPAALVTVHGTEFVVNVTSDGVTRVTVIEGRVDVAAQQVTVEVSAGQATTVQPGQSPAPPALVATPTPPVELLPIHTPSIPPVAASTPRPPTATDTPLPARITNPPLLPTATATPLPPTATDTPLPPTATGTLISPAATETRLPPTATDTPRPPTATDTPRPPTATNTPPPTATRTPQPPTATNTPPPTATNTPRPTATRMPQPPTATDTPRPTATSTPWTTATPQPTEMPTLVPTETEEPEETPEPTKTEEPEDGSRYGGVGLSSGPHGGDGGSLTLVLGLAAAAGMGLVKIGWDEDVFSGLSSPLYGRSARDALAAI